MDGPQVALHLIVDGYSADEGLLSDEKLIYAILDEFPAQVGMVKVIPPVVRTYIGRKPDMWGVSGLVVIAESHIGIHTWVERKFVNIDMFSCKDFDAPMIIRALAQRLRLVKLKYRLLDRNSGRIDLLGYGDETAVGAQYV